MRICAFLPVEFDAFNRPLDESKARFLEGIEQVGQLLEGENVTCDGEFHSFRDVTILPRTTQKPRPPFGLPLLLHLKASSLQGQTVITSWRFLDEARRWRNS